MQNPRYIDANKIKIIGIFEFDDETGELMVSTKDIRKGINQTPTEDVIPVIRCKDCKYYAKHKTIKVSPDGYDHCYYDPYPEPHVRHFNDYCSKAVKRDDKCVKEDV